MGAPDPLPGTIAVPRRKYHRVCMTGTLPVPGRYYRVSPLLVTQAVVPVRDRQGTSMLSARFSQKAVSLAVPRPILSVLGGSGSTAVRFYADVYLVLKAVAVLPLSAPVLPVLLNHVSFLHISNHVISRHTHKTRKPINY
jgi:hypothetical protein